MKTKNRKKVALPQKSEGSTSITGTVAIKYVSHTEATVENYRKIDPKILEPLGYRMTKKQIPLGTKPHRHAIIEMENIDDPQALVTFSLLFSVSEQLGIVLPYGMDYYKTHALC